MERVQFCAGIIMIFLTLTLVLPIPRRIERGTWVSRVRNMLATGTTLIGTQFLLQFHLGLRSMGVTQGVFLNLLFFIPASWMFNMAILYLQRQKRAKRYEWLVGFDVWMIVIALLVVTNLTNGVPFIEDSREMFWAEVFCSVLFAVMQFFYYYQEMRELRQLHIMLKNYYDQDKAKMLRWFEIIVAFLMFLALPIPLIIFGKPALLGVYAILFIAGIYYLVLNFMFFVVSRDINQLKVAIMVEEEGNDDTINVDETVEKEEGLSEKELKHIEAAVSRWLANGGHLHNGITIQNAADEMKIPRYQLTSFLRTTEQKLFNPWISYQRVEEAKRQMIAHPEWSNDVIAETCGFGSRSYFQTVFRRQTGMTPTQYLLSGKAESLS